MVVFLQFGTMDLTFGSLDLVLNSIRIIPIRSFFTGMTNNTSGFPPTFLDFSANAGFFHVEVADFARTLNIEFHNDGFNTISLYSQIVITLPDGVAITPLPAALPLFVTGLGALGLFGWRRKRKAQATA